MLHLMDLAMNTISLEGVSTNMNSRHDGHHRVEDARSRNHSNSLSSTPSATRSTDCRRLARSLGRVLLPLVTTGLQVGCGNSSATPSDLSDSSDELDAAIESAADAAIDAERDADSFDDPCESQSMFAVVSDGWEEYPMMEGTYRIYVPSTRDSLPPPPVWEACADVEGPVPYSCLQLAWSWPNLEQQLHTSVPRGRSAYSDSDDKLVMELDAHLRLEPIDCFNRSMRMVVEADGPVRQAYWHELRSSQFPQLLPPPMSIAPGKSSWVFERRGSSQDLDRTVVLGGDDTLLRPPVLVDGVRNQGTFAEVLVGSHFYSTFVKGTLQNDVFNWDGKRVDSLGLRGWRWWIRDSLWSFDTSSDNASVFRWTEQEGIRVFASFGVDDGSHSIGLASTDGANLVWVQRFPPGEGSECSSEWLMTASLSTDPSVFQPRRVSRLWPWAILHGINLPVVVGCGYAAFDFEPLCSTDLMHDHTTCIGSEKGLFVMRLSDGVHWKLPCSGDARRHNWHSPLAITCHELFAQCWDGNSGRTCRVRLDSLGPGLPPLGIGDNEADPSLPSPDIDWCSFAGWSPSTATWESRVSSASSHPSNPPTHPSSQPHSATNTQDGT